MPCATGGNSRLLSPERNPDDHRQKSMLLCWNVDLICDGRPSKRNVGCFVKSPTITVHIHPGIYSSFQSFPHCIYPSALIPVLVIFLCQAHWHHSQPHVFNNRRYLHSGAFHEKGWLYNLHTSLICVVYNVLTLGLKTESPFLVFAGSIVYLGMMVGAFFWGGMSDKVGRRQCLLICMSTNGFFAFLSSFVQGYGVFLVCRIVAGFG